MICSEKELNISDEHEGIMVLPNHLNIGKDFSSSYGYKFLSLQLDITPNRADAFSHIGVARDIAAVTKRKLLYKPNKIRSFNKEYNFEVKLLLSVSIVALTYHTLAGLRHMLIDFSSYGHELDQARLSAIITFVLTFVISIFLLMEVW